MKNSSKIFWFLFFGFYFLFFALYSLFSYSLTAPNLVLSSWAPYWNFQQYMWETFFNNRELLTQSFIALTLGLFVIYFLILNKLHKPEGKKNETRKKILFGFLPFFFLVLFFSNNALSYDVFNYMFNAKMVLLYHANPHISVALDFPQDQWLRFMHNTHTPAPYGYGWTIFSLLPFALGMGKFLPTWLIFRFFSVLSVGFLYLAIKYFAKQFSIKLQTFDYAILFLNPLFLIEMVSNSHNDLWMIAPAIFSLALVKNSKLSIRKILLALALLGFSISMKLATIALIPVFVVLIFDELNWFKKFTFYITENVPLISSVLLFLPLLTERSKQFLPWYLVWSLSFIPLIKMKDEGFRMKNISEFWKILLITFSLTSMLRYIPYLWFGEYSDSVILQQKMITWSAAPIALILIVIRSLYTLNSHPARKE